MNIQTQTRAVWVGSDIPESFSTDIGELIPIRYLKKKYNIAYECYTIKYICKKKRIEIHKPNGLYNIPSIHKNDLETLLSFLIK